MLHRGPFKCLTSPVPHFSNALKFGSRGIFNGRVDNLYDSSSLLRPVRPVMVPYIATQLAFK